MVPNLKRGVDHFESVFKTARAAAFQLARLDATTDPTAATATVSPGQSASQRSCTRARRWWWWRRVPRVGGCQWVSVGVGGCRWVSVGVGVGPVRHRAPEFRCLVVPETAAPYSRMPQCPHCPHCPPYPPCPFSSIFSLSSLSVSSLSTLSWCSSSSSLSPPPTPLTRYGGGYLVQRRRRGERHQP